MIQQKGTVQYQNINDIILMLNCNRPIRQSLQGSKRIQKNTHTASIILKPQDSFTDALYLPLREAVNKRLDTQNLSHTQSKNNKKILDRSVRLDKSPTLKIQKQNKYEMAVAKPQYKLKMSNQIHNRVQTDRKSLRKSMDKAMKTIRLKTDYNEVLEARQKEASASKPSHMQVSTKNTEQYSNKIVYIPKSDLAKLHRQYKKLLQENMALKREMSFVNKSSSKCICNSSNSVLKALNL